MDWKLDLYKKVAAHLPEHAIVASNTSGLSINTLAEALPENLRHRFCGIHFFNPPRYMHLVELIPNKATDAGVLDRPGSLRDHRAGQGRGPRQGHAELHRQPRRHRSRHAGDDARGRAFGLGFDVVDELTGKAIGRAQSATFRTADVVGLDTMAHVIQTLADTLPDDPLARVLQGARVLSALIDKGALGQKTGAGFYKNGKNIQLLDPASRTTCRPAARPTRSPRSCIKNPAEKFGKLLRESSNPQAQFLWAILRDIFHYAAVHLGDIAETARDVDFAMRWGFGLKQGPFEIWQEAGWKQVAAGSPRTSTPARH